MTWAELPYPSTSELGNLAEAGVRPHAALWLGWTEAALFEALVQRPPASHAWLESLPSSFGPIARVRRLRQNFASKPAALERGVFLWAEAAGLLVPQPLESALPRRRGSLDADRFLRAAADAGHLVAPPLAADGSLRHEAVLLAVPVFTPILLTVGKTVELRLLRQPGFRPEAPLERPREALAGLLAALAPPPASAWSAAWELARRPLGLSAPLASPYQLSERGPILPVRLAPALHARVAGFWIQAGDGPWRSLARIVPA